MTIRRVCIVRLFALFALTLSLTPSVYAAQQNPVAKWIEAELKKEPSFKSGRYHTEEIINATTAKGDAAQVTFEFPYRNMEGAEQLAKGRIYVGAAVLTESTGFPVLVMAHYGTSLEASAHWLDLGWIVVASHANAEPCAGNSLNLCRTLVHFARRLPGSDSQHLMVSGGSAGGYGALELAAHAFPLAAVCADVPVVNWAYNIAFFQKNRALITPPDGKDASKSPVPVMFSVSGIVDSMVKVVGPDLSDPAWWYLSPASHPDRITCPASLLFAGGDILVPLPQASRQHLRQPDLSAFPPGFLYGLEECCDVPQAEKPLEEILPTDKTKIFIKVLGDDYPEFNAPRQLAGEKPKVPPVFERPFDPDYQWGVVILDEGAATPRSGHARRMFNQTPTAFLTHYREAPLGLDQLTPLKLRWSMDRYAGREPEQLIYHGEGHSEGLVVHRLDFPAYEQLDVVTGLLDYARTSPQHAERLQSLYANLPESQRSLGATVDVAMLEKARDKLLKQSRNQKSEVRKKTKKP